MKKHLLSLLPALLCSSVLSAFEVKVEDFSNGNIPPGYVNVDDGITADEVTNVSDAPFVDYLIPNNSGTAGITAQKEGGAFIVDSTAGELPGGANNVSSPDVYHVAFTWSDGAPLPFGADFFGVSWGGWDASSTVSLITRINLASPEPTRIYHWFNDGWNYANHSTLEGHNLTVFHFDASGNQLNSFSAVLNSGGAEDVFGDHRQFYALIIDVQRTGEGDFLLINQEAGNIGYKGTAVALEESSQTGDWGILEDNWTENSAVGWVYGYPGGWGRALTLGWIYHESFPWLYQFPFGWLLDMEIEGQDIFDEGVFLYSSAYGYLFVQSGNGGWFYSYELDVWDNFLDPSGAIPL